MAVRMVLVTASGRVMGVRWPPQTLEMCAPARLDFSSYSASGMMLSRVPISDQAALEGEGC
jgi:hypothetical protein